MNLFKLICPISNAFKCIKNDTSSPSTFNVDKSDSISGTMMKTKLDAIYLPGDYFRCKVVFKDLINDFCEVKVFDRSRSPASLDSDGGNDIELGDIKSTDLPSHYQNM